MNITTDTYIPDVVKPRTLEGQDPLDDNGGESAVPTRPRVCLLGVTFDSPNLGIGALLDGSIRGILTCFPEASISVLDYGHKPLKKVFNFAGCSVPVKFVNLRFSKKVYLTNNIAYLIGLALLLRYLMPAKIRKYFLTRNPIISHISQVDTVVSIAGGDSFSDIYGLVRLIYVSLPQVLVLIMGKRLVLLPQTLGPFKGVLARLIARFVLSRATLVYSRDHGGLIEAMGFVNESDTAKIRICCDLGFLLEPAKPKKLDLADLINKTKSGTCVVGLNISGLLYAGGYDGKNMFGLKTDYKQTIKRLLAFLLVKDGTSVLLVPHVYSEPNGSSVESDEQVCEQVYDELKDKYEGRLWLARGVYTSNEIKYVIGLCDVFIGSRMHACIAALSQGIPAVAISYSDKFAGVMKMLGMNLLVADPRKMQIDEILEVVGRALEQRRALAQHLSTTLPGLRAQIMDTLQSIFGR